MTEAPGRPGLEAQLTTDPQTGPGAGLCPPLAPAPPRWLRSRAEWCEQTPLRDPEWGALGGQAQRWGSWFPEANGSSVTEGRLGGRDAGRTSARRARAGTQAAGGTASSSCMAARGGSSLGGGPWSLGSGPVPARQAGPGPCSCGCRPRTRSHSPVRVPIPACPGQATVTSR